MDDSCMKELTGGDRRFRATELKLWGKLDLPIFEFVQNALEFVVVRYI